MTELRTATDVGAVADDQFMPIAKAASGTGPFKVTLAALKTFFQNGVASFPALTGKAGKVLGVKSDETGVEWIAGGGGGSGLPAGGTTGQVLTKDSGTDGDATWHTPTGGGGGGTYERDRVIPELADFTGFNTSTNTALSDTPFGIYMKSAQNSQGIRFLRSDALTIPATPWRVIMRGQTNRFNFEPSYCCSLIVRNATSGKLYVMSPYNGNFLIQSWSDLSSYDGTLYGVASGWQFNWYAVRNDGTNLYFETSADGVNWSILFQVAIGWIGSVTEIGFGHLANSAPAAAVFQSFEIEGA